MLWARHFISIISYRKTAKKSIIMHIYLHVQQLEKCGFRNSDFVKKDEKIGGQKELSTDWFMQVAYACSTKKTLLFSQLAIWFSTRSCTTPPTFFACSMYSLYVSCSFSSLSAVLSGNNSALLSRNS